MVMAPSRVADAEVGPDTASFDYRALCIRLTRAGVIIRREDFPG
jgi:hypothetical protein